MILDLFKTVGFNASEAKVFIALAELGKASAKVLSRKVDLPRTTTYSILENLSVKGVVATEKGSAGNYFVLNSPSTLLRLISIARAELEEKEAAAQKLVEYVTPYFQSRNYSVPKIQFFEGAKNVETMLYDYVAKWQQSMDMTDQTWWGYQDAAFVDLYRKWLEYYWKDKPKTQKVWLFSNVTKTEVALKGKVPNRIIKPIPSGFVFSSTIWVCGEYVVMISSRQKPHYAFQIKDAVFGSNLRVVFELLWQARWQ